MHNGNTSTADLCAVFETAPPTAPIVNPQPNRQETIGELFVQSYSQLSETAYAAHPKLLVFDAERVLQGLADSLPKYRGPAEPEQFLAWASRQVKREAQRYAITERILSENRRLIMAAIHRCLEGSIARDYSVDEEIVFNEIALLVFQNAHSLNRQGTAKLSTRLFAMVKTHMRFGHTTKWNRRHRSNRRRVERGQGYGTEVLSAAERKSIAAEGYEKPAA